MKYVIWTLYEDTDQVRYYIINQQLTCNKKHSVWNSLLEAKAVCAKLNEELERRAHE